MATELSQDRDLSQGSAGRRGCGYVYVKVTYSTIMSEGYLISRLLVPAERRLNASRTALHRCPKRVGPAISPKHG